MSRPQAGLSSVDLLHTKYTLVSRVVLQPLQYLLLIFIAQATLTAALSEALFICEVVLSAARVLAQKVCQIIKWLCTK